MCNSSSIFVCPLNLILIYRIYYTNIFFFCCCQELEFQLVFHYFVYKFRQSSMDVLGSLYLVFNCVSSRFVINDDIGRWRSIPRCPPSAIFRCPIVSRISHILSALLFYFKLATSSLVSLVISNFGSMMDYLLGQTPTITNSSNYKLWKQ